VDRTLVFLSHSSEEYQLAVLLKDRLERKFLNLINIFVSTDPKSIELGSKWLDRLTESLQTCAAMVILCSEYSVKLPWINFEAGAAWVRGIPVIPICHTDIRPVSLPLPLNMLQGIEANRPEDLQKLYGRLASALGPTTIAPDDNFEDFATSIRVFEEEYGLLRHVTIHIRGIVEALPDLQILFRPDGDIPGGTGPVSEITYQKLLPHLSWLKGKGLIDFDVKAKGLFFSESAIGSQYELTIEVREAYRQIASQIKL
jgi:hypothetical protein